MKINNTELSIVKGDITEVTVDAIVNSANTALVMGEGLALAIKKKGGQVIEDQACAQAPITVGQAVKTTAGSLAFRHIIHAAIKEPDVPADEVTIRNAIRNSLVLAQQLGIHSLAFPAMGCARGGFPAKAVAKIMAQEIYKYATYEASPLADIYCVLFDEELFTLFQQQVMSYLNHLQKKLGQGPFVTVDIIIEVEGGIVLIERSNPPFGWAIPGGFVDYGEMLEQCAIREAKEETSLDIYDVEQMHTYSDPRRDPRFHTITTVFVAKARGLPRAGDDAQNARVVSHSEIASLTLAFDHAAVLGDYKKFKQQKDERT